MKSDQDHKLGKPLIIALVLGGIVVGLLWLVQMNQWNAKEEPSVDSAQESTH